MYIAQYRVHRHSIGIGLGIGIGRRKERSRMNYEILDSYSTIMLEIRLEESGTVMQSSL